MSLPVELEAVARQYRGFAVATRGQSACFEEWSSGVAGDEEVLGWIAALPRGKQQPNLVFAAARWNGVAAPGPYAGLRAALLSDGGTIRATILERRTQTNEVGRLATLVPALARVAAEAGPLALLEVGTSAGLCLFPDRYDYAWPPLGTLAGSGGPVLTAPAEGPLPVPAGPLPVAWRGGIDLAPVDVRDEQAVAWLETCVWPEQDERRARLRTAVAIARTDPPLIAQGDLFDLLDERVAEAGRHGTVVVFHSAVAMYLDRPGRARFVGRMRGLVAAGRGRWVSNEGRDVLPEVTATVPAEGPQPDERLSFVLGLDGRAVALTHQHGAGIRWL
ncbi:hypothetical protein SAMN04488544_2649 [Microlunatus sagamiharensis]|uniref:DUF2332 domain-containing protein n=1 Tax=Microlunatus sagamiharensis TaxID=546874 RepID=A0A1H2MSV0_9ACTN|nr:DUF2332 domain-containing protein [Microlunatus sagamiharensis]SDU96280.1 hypothetical protein SAMN04488544_2649 [Microlunatus sagamiharensis]